MAQMRVSISVVSKIIYTCTTALCFCLRLLYTSCWRQQYFVIHGPTVINFPHVTTQPPFQVLNSNSCTFVSSNWIVNWVDRYENFSDDLARPHIHQEHFSTQILTRLIHIHNLRQTSDLRLKIKMMKVSHCNSHILALYFGIPQIWDWEFRWGKLVTLGRDEFII